MAIGRRSRANPLSIGSLVISSILTTPKSYTIRFVSSTIAFTLPNRVAETASSHKAAGARLAEMLSLTLENAPSDWRRQSIQQAISDVRAIAEGDA